MKKLLAFLSVLLLVVTTAAAQDMSVPELIYPNNTFRKSYNAAGDAIIDVLGVDTSDNTVLNTNSGDLLLIEEGGVTGLIIDPSASSITAGAGLNLKLYDNGGGIQFYSTTMRWAIDTAGQLVQQPTGSHLKYTNDFNFYADTSDGSDDLLIQFCGGGSCSATRGAYIQAAGNEEGSTGRLLLASGDAGAATVAIANNNTIVWEFSDGNLNQNSTNGGNIVLTKSSATGIYYGGVPLFVKGSADETFLYSPSSKSLYIRPGQNDAWEFQSDGDIVQRNSGGVMRGSLSTGAFWEPNEGDDLPDSPVSGSVWLDTNDSTCTDANADANDVALCLYMDGEWILLGANDN